jgi:hypothetical protein
MDSPFTVQQRTHAASARFDRAAHSADRALYQLKTSPVRPRSSYLSPARSYGRSPAHSASSYELSSPASSRSPRHNTLAVDIAGLTSHRIDTADVSRQVTEARTAALRLDAAIRSPRRSRNRTNALSVPRSADDSFRTPEPSPRTSSVSNRERFAGASRSPLRTCCRVQSLHGCQTVAPLSCAAVS